MVSSEITSVRSRSIERGMKVLDGLSKAGHEISLSELSNNVALNQSTVYRILTTFKEYGFVEQRKKTSEYRLGPMVLSLASSYMRSLNIREVVFEELTDLRDFTSETVHYAVRSGNEVIYVEKIQGIHPVGTISNTIGQRAPLHSTAVGKSLLAWLPQETLKEIIQNYQFTKVTQFTITDPETFFIELAKVKAEGFSHNRQEAEIGLAAIASPIFGAEGVVGAISITGSTSRIEEIIESLNIKEKLKETCNRISTIMKFESDLS